MVLSIMQNKFQMNLRFLDSNYSVQTIVFKFMELIMYSCNFLYIYFLVLSIIQTNVKYGCRKE